MNPHTYGKYVFVDVLIIGGGNAGLSAAGRLLRRGVTGVAVIEPHRVHTYRPQLSYVGAGQSSMNSAERTQRSVTPRGCTWIADSAVSVDTATRTVRCASGVSFRYRDLVLGPGLVPDTKALPGIFEALESPTVASNYLDRAEQTWKLVQSMPIRGRAVFTVPRAPVSCTGTTIKPLFLAADHWRRTRRLPGVDITLVIDRAALLPSADLTTELLRHLDDLGVQVLHRTRVSKLNPDESTITVTGDEGCTTLPYDMLHLVPRFRGPRWVHDSGLTGDDPHGLVDIDPHTFRHRTHPNVWAAGDGATVDTDPSGGALRKQISILVDNLLAARRNEAVSRYDGYTVAPIATDARRLIVGEFDRSGSLASSLPSLIDPLKPRRTAWAFDRYVLPRIYWNLLLNGHL
ncbi:NAD(P)/FAD-dependent oxidoreductase [Antrihabitans cavernicola]|uniref:NAD(P)/FAD-dependent oxidoreductase n=1 Tax=Antrihabitans cavernicola TaxID=2495913 RepID=UPI001F1B48E3|nr:FAD/NAD(P)-binding oxidoreductase [Spelaeibacter cavernicola]